MNRLRELIEHHYWPVMTTIAVLNGIRIWWPEIRAGLLKVLQ